MSTPNDPHAPHGQPVNATASAGETRQISTPAPTAGAATEFKYDFKRFIAAILLVSITCLLLMCLVSGRWIKTDKVGGVWTEFSIWGSCQCVDITESFHCSERERKTNAVKSFSIIAAAFEFFAVVVMLKYPSGKDGRFAVAIFSFLAAVSLILTIAIWGDLFDKTMCGIQLKKDYHLDWAYGIRIVEFVFVAALMVVVLVVNRGPGLVLFSILCLYLTVFTTTSRGWASWKNHLNGGQAQTQEFGIFDYCTCDRIGNYPCGNVRRLARAAEAFEIISTAFALILTALVVFAAPRAPTAIVAWFLFIFMILPWIFVAAIWNERYCGQKFKDFPTTKLAWAFGLQVAFSGLYIPTAALITMLRSSTNGNKP